MSQQTEELELAPPQAGEAPMKQLAPFDAFRAQAEELKVTAETLTVTDINDRAGMKLARATRLELRDVRVAIEHRRKELGEEHLRATQRINADAKALKDIIEPLESRLKDQEEFIERELARIADEKRVARAAELAPFLNGPVSVDLGTMTDEAYAGLLIDAKLLHNAKIAREKAEYEAEIARQKEERERIEAQRLENERLKKEAAEREEAAKKEREAAAAALAKEREEAARREREAQARADAEAKKLREEAAERERVAAAKAKAEAAKAQKEREAIEAKAKADRDAREKIEAELAVKKAAEEKVEADRLAAEKAAAAAPDKAKLAQLVADIRYICIPRIANESVLDLICSQRDQFTAWIEKQAETL